MIIVNCEQGTDAWKKSRAGVITASMFHVARSRVGMLNEQQAQYVALVRSGMDKKEAAAAAGYKSAPTGDSIAKALVGEKVGDFSEAAKNYAFELAVERIGGEPMPSGFDGWQARRGRELENNARMEHEAKAGVFVDAAPFFMTDDGAFGASPDGLIDDDGLSEYKCYLDPVKLRAFWFENDASCLMDQAQGQLWITGRKYIHVGVYCPMLASVGKRLWLQEFKRDEDYIEKLEADMWEFKLLVDEYEERLRCE